MRKTLFIAAYLLSMFFNEVTGQELTQNIRGQIIDAQSLSPLPGATIVIEGTDPVTGATSDGNGRFEILNFPVGRLKIKVTFIGYKPRYFNNLELIKGKELVLTVKLEEQVFKTDEIVVTAKTKKEKPINDMALVSARSFSVEETERFAGSLGDPSRMAANYAGVLAVNDSRNDIIIRGNSPTGLLWRVEGVTIPNPNHFGASGSNGGPVSILNNNQLTNSDFFTGAFPAEYGDAISGVFDLKMRSGNTAKREYVGQIGFNGFEFGAEGPFKKGKFASYMINYRYSTLAVFDLIGMDMGIGGVPQYQDLSFKLDIPTKKAGKFTLIGIGGISYIEFLAEKDSTGQAQYSTISGTNLYNGGRMGAIILSNKYYFSKNTSLKNSIAFSGNGVQTKIDSLYENGDRYTGFEENTNQFTYNFNSLLNTKINAKNTIRAGLELYNYNLQSKEHYREGMGSPMISIVDADERNLYDLQSYVQWQHKFTDDLTLVTGAHYQEFLYNNTRAIEPRLGFRWAMNIKHSLSLGAGMHSKIQPLYVYFVETELDSGVYTRTNTDLDFTRSNQVSLAYDWLMAENFRLKAEIYYQSLYDVPIEKSLSIFSMVNYGAEFYNQRVDSLVNKGTGENYGVEFTLEKFFSNNYYFLLTASLFESTYVASDDVKRSTAFNGNFVLNTLGGYEFNLNERMKLTTSLKGVWAGGKRNLFLDQQASIDADEAVYIDSKAYEMREDDYFRVDVRIGFKLNGKKTTQEWALDLQNLTNHQNVFSKSYDPVNKEIITNYQQSFYPMMLYRVNF